MKKKKPFFDKDALLWAFGGISAGAILCLALAPHYLGQIQDSAFLAGVKAAQTITPLPSLEQPSLPRLEVANSAVKQTGGGVMMGECRKRQTNLTSLLKLNSMTALRAAESFLFSVSAPVSITGANLKPSRRRISRFLIMTPISKNWRGKAVTLPCIMSASFAGNWSAKF
jgi:hypothetical protein